MDSPVANPAYQSGCMLLDDILFIVLSRYFVETAFQLGNASFNASDKPVLREALILTIFWIPFKVWWPSFNITKTTCSKSKWSIRFFEIKIYLSKWGKNYVN